MTSEPEDFEHDSVGAWAKKYYFASRAMIDSTLRPYNLGSTQWYVLHHLAHEGPTPQRDLVQKLGIERASMTGIVATLVRKGLVSQETASGDQRRRTLSLTPVGERLWQELPNPIEHILTVAFGDVDQDDLATTLRVLRSATRRLNDRA
ncbi:winged helix-turn-helix transcriptional regulator [Kineosporia sp. J2-2]|uniref:Winged helix-turn-helix transcriptional regulator n=1 Tax=Kineosporia corallincola TaxID=2835133 RepID=A0ABS5TGI1_9ACTN|nr:MarR family winged helix-turn-helix transcriptional regulator [Kineosporia corallincola]MBT0770205.1 winged helix-turn-helix transcriptional regulator [Kineosporia corallincola]